MKYVIVVLSLMTFACAQNTKSTDVKTETTTTTTTNQVVQEKAVVKVVGVKDFKTLITGEDIQLIDVRTPEEYGAGKIVHAKNINFYDSDFKTLMSALDKELPVAVYCKSGGRSGKAAKMLQALGFTKVYDLQGGYTAWDAPLQ